jgi:hypothetical protein
MKLPGFTAESSFYKREKIFRVGQRIFGIDSSGKVLAQRRADLVCYLSCRIRGGGTEACFDECSGWRPADSDFIILSVTAN